MDSLTNRSQRVLVNNTLSDLLHTSAASPQGCVLLALLFILYTDDSSYTQPICHMVKFADDTVLLSLLSGLSQHHSPAFHEFVKWWDNSHLELNVSKTKEMVVTFSNKQRELPVVVITTINGKPRVIVEKYKHLGAMFDNLLKFASNMEEILRKCQQQQYLLRKLNSFRISKDILTTYYYIRAP